MVIAKLKSLVKPWLNYVSFATRTQKSSFYLIIFFAFIGSIFESLGISMFLPLLKNSSPEAGSGPGSKFILGLFSWAAAQLPSFSPTSVALAVIGVFFCAKGLVRFFEGIYKGITISHLTQRIRLDLFSAYKKLEYKSFLSLPKGNLAGLFSQETERATTGFQSLCSMLGSIGTFTAFLTFALFQNYQITLICITLGGAASILLRIISKKISNQSKDITQGSLQLNGVMIHALLAFKYFKSTRTFEKFEGLLSHSVGSLANSRLKQSFYEALFSGLQQPISAVILISVIYIDHGVRGTEIQSSLVVLILVYKVMSTLIGVQSAWQNFSLSRGHIDILLQYLDMFESMAEAPLKKPSSEKIESLQIKNIVFKTNEQTVLNNLSFDIRKNGMYAIIGLSGSGKTTLLDVLSGLYSPDSGKVLVNNVEIAFDEFKARLNPVLGLVTQDPIIFNASIYENVVLNFHIPHLDDITKAEAERAIRLSGLDEFAQTLPDGYHTLLGDGGIQISGGQKQRLALAREIFKRPQFLFLDEATSALDAPTESSLIKSLLELKKTMKILVITHRPKILKDCDQVWILDKGQFIAQGPLNELLEIENPAFTALLRNSDDLGNAPSARAKPAPEQSLFFNCEVEGSHHSFRVINFSKGGLALDTSSYKGEISPGTVCFGKLLLPNDSISMTLRLVHRTQERAGWTIVEMEPGHRDSFYSFIESNIKRAA